MWAIEATDEFAERPHLTDERFTCASADEAAGRIEDLTGIDYEVARDDLSREERLTYESDGRTVTALRTAA